MFRTYSSLKYFPSLTVCTSFSEPNFKEMEADDIEDGEILEDESNEPTFPIKECPNNNEFPIVNKDFPHFEIENFEQKLHDEVKNSFAEYFSHHLKDKRNHHHESHKNSRRDRSTYSDIPRKRRRMDDGDGCIRNDKTYYEKNNKSNYEVPSMKNYDEETNDDDMIYVLGGSLNDSEKPHMPMKNEMPYDLNDSMMYPNEDENDDSRPYHKRSPLRRDNYKKDRSRPRGLSDRGPDRGFDRGSDRGPDRGFDRGPDRGSDRGLDRGPDRCNVGMAKRRGRGGGVGVRGGGEMHRKGKPRDREDNNDFYNNQGKNQRGNEPMYSHQYNMPRKLEVCKFYLNDCCTKRDKCIYMHNDFPCKYHHTPGSTCHLGKSCKFSHSKLDEIQRAVLKKYADIPCKEIDDMQRFHRENSGSSTYSAHKEKKESANANNQNSRIPSLFDVKIPIPPEFRDEEGSSTPMPSPQSGSQIYDDDENDETIYNKMNHDHNDRHTETTTDGEDTDRKHSNEDTAHKSHHRKKSKKGDDHSSDSERRKHSEKRKKHSKKEERKFDKKKKHEQKQVDDTYSNMFPELEEPPWDADFDKEDEPQEQAPALALTPAVVTPAIVEEQRSPKHEQKEPSDALSHLPKKQQELFLRIQQHQKEAETGQNSNIDEKDDEEDGKADVNWYSSDEEEPEKPESSSPLATILRTIQTNSNNVPSNEKSNNSNPVNTYLPNTSSSRPAPSQETDSVMVDPSQLANIDLSDEVTQLLKSVMKTDASSSNQPASTDSLPSNSDRDDRVFSHSRRSSDDKNYQIDQMTSNVAKPSQNEDVDLRYLNANSILNTASLFASNSHESNPNNDIDFRTLPFKPVPIHDAATEINASITAHPPMEYKLKPLSFIPRVNYASMTDVAKMCVNDPRFKKKLMNPSSTENVENAHSCPPFIPQDPRHALAVKSMNETPRIDPRLADPRKPHTIDPRLDTKNAVPNSKLDQRPDPRMMEAKVPDKEPVRPIVDFRDPRLKSCKFPEIPMPFPIMTPLPPILPEMAAPMPVRKEDPRLKYRANQK
ncbi:general transcriptional corepressor trfA isoform X3 [Planococcus citri]|uniref:general transcriptional corepressor trfA isoform X3 n=1 Tax=Planococcus citri TaxID=170843 RepID=UPI0031F7E631